MEQVELKADVRAERGTAACRRLRRKGLVPGVLYGLHKESINLAIHHEDLERALRSGSRMLTLSLGEGSERVLLKEVQYDAFGDGVIHVDFARVAMHEELEIEVPIVLKGTPRGVEVDHGILEHTLHEVTVRCLPDRIPENIVANVAEMEIGHVLRLGDLEAPDGVKILGDPETTVATVAPPVAEEEVVEAAAEGEAAEPEVIGREEKESEEEQEEEK